MTILLRSGYIVKKDEISERQRSKLVRDLTVHPVSFGGPTSNFIRDSDKFRVYRESDSRYRIPRFYGVSTFGIPSRNKLMNSSVSIDMTFNGSLKKELLQHDACKAVIDQLNSIGGGILSLPTGYGKTTCALYILCQLKVRTLIVVHKEFLMNQWAERITQFIPDAQVGIVRQNKVQVVGKDIVLVMLQSVAMKEYPPDTFNGFGMTIIDETHHICSNTFSRALFNISCKYMLGLSATPERKDGLTKVLHWFLGPMAFEIQRENQTSVQVDVATFPSTEYSGVDVPLSVTGQVSMPAIVTLLCENDRRNAFIADIVSEKLCEGRKIIILSDRRSHCELLLLKCTEMHPDKSCGLYMGGMKQSVLKKNEECDAIFATYSLAHEGLDIPTLNTLVMATPKSDVVQSCGRILREAGTRTLHPCIIDVVDEFGTLPRQHQRRSTFYRKVGFNIEKFHLKNTSE